MGKGKDAAEKCGMCGICGIICGVAFLVLALLALSVTKIALGAINIDDCPLQPMLPIWLIVSSCVPIFLSGLTGRFRKLIESDDDNDDDKPNETCSGYVVPFVISVVGVLFSFSWLIAGTYWVSTVWTTVKYNACGTGNCCNSILADFSLATVILDWTFIFVPIIITVCSTVLVTKDVSAPEDP